MAMNLFQQEAAMALPQMEFRYQESLSKHTSFRIGGPAEIMAFPKDAQELSSLLKLSQKLDIKPAILGAGTNILAPDEGIPGLVVCLKDCLNGIELLPGSRVQVMAGVTMSRAAVFAANHGLSGLEFAHGIPGSLGGGICMNAGAYGGEIGKICESVTVMDASGQMRQMGREDLKFCYRHSILEETGDVVVSAVLALADDLPDAIQNRMKELLSKRSASQPLDLPSAGSAFKRPAGGYAAALIEQSGLKGFRVGNAAISSKHAGFAVNLGGATARDVRSLLQQVSDRVYADSGIQLEPEIRIW